VSDEADGSAGVCFITPCVGKSYSDSIPSSFDDATGMSFTDPWCISVGKVLTEGRTKTASSDGHRETRENIDEIMHDLETIEPMSVAPATRNLSFVRFLPITPGARWSLEYHRKRSALL